MKPKKNKQILIAGATGLIGQQLTRILVEMGYNVMILTRSPKQVHEEFPNMVGYIEWTGIFTNWLVREVEKSMAIVNLAGEGVANKRWTKRRRMQLLRSRLATTRALAKACQFANKKPEVFIQASAIGYYPNSQNEVLNEESIPGTSILSRITKDWESIAKLEVPDSIRLVLVRTGVVLSKDGGMLPKMLQPVKLLLGGWFGSGKQVVSWIHIYDEVNAIVHLMHAKEAKGAFNLVAPNPVSQKELSKRIGEKINRPVWLPIPAFAVKLLLGQLGEELLLSGNRVEPKKLQEIGFHFAYPTIDLAINDLI